MCEDNGGSLASIRSSEENSWIVDTFLPPWDSGRDHSAIKILNNEIELVIFLKVFLYQYFCIQILRRYIEFLVCVSRIIKNISQHGKF